MHSVVWNTVQVTCASSAPSRFWTLITCHTLLILDNRPTHGLCFILKSLMYHSIGFSSGTVILKPHLLTGHVITFKNLHHARKVILSTSVNTKLHSLLRLLNFQLLKLKQSLTQSTYIYHRSNKKRMSVHLFIFWKMDWVLAHSALGGRSNSQAQIQINTYIIPYYWQLTWMQ